MSILPILDAFFVLPFMLGAERFFSRLPPCLFRLSVCACVLETDPFRLRLEACAAPRSASFICERFGRFVMGISITGTWRGCAGVIAFVASGAAALPRSGVELHGKRMVHPAAAVNGRGLPPVVSSCNVGDRVVKVEREGVTLRNRMWLA